MAKDKDNVTGPIGGKNRDRRIPPGGRPSKPGTKPSGNQESRKNPPEHDGYRPTGEGPR